MTDLAQRWGGSQVPGELTAMVWNRLGPMSNTMIAQAATALMKELGPGFEFMVSVQLNALSWKTYAKGFITDPELLKGLAADEEDYEGVDIIEGSKEEQPLGTVLSAAFRVRRVK